MNFEEYQGLNEQMDTSRAMKSLDQAWNPRTIIMQLDRLKSALEARVGFIKGKKETRGEAAQRDAVEKARESVYALDNMIKKLKTMIV